MLKFENHKKLWTFNKTLNDIYKNSSPLYKIEDSWDGFQWISADEKDNNVISFIRKDDCGKQIVVIINFSGNLYRKYRLGVEKGEYRLILNTDEKKYGGNGTLKGKTFRTVKRKAHGRNDSISFDLPKFTGLYFEKI